MDNLRYKSEGSPFILLVAIAAAVIFIAMAVTIYNSYSDHITITYEISNAGQFESIPKAAVFSASFIAKSADHNDQLKHLGKPEYISDSTHFYLKFKKRFADHAEAILWTQQAEKAIDAFIAANQGSFQKVIINRVKHKIDLN